MPLSIHRKLIALFLPLFLPGRGGRYLLAGMKLKLLPGLYSPELLESRIAPATFLVTSLLDDGTDGTLRKEIADANTAAGADTITFDAALFPGGAPGTITLVGAAEILITGTTTIKGPGIDKLTISGSNASRIFNISDGGDPILHPTVISGLTLVDGNSGGSGGAISSTESLALTNVVIDSGTAGGAGGGISVFTTGKVALNRVQFLANTAGGLLGDYGGGAYLFASAGITVVKSLFVGNSSGDSGGGLFARTANATAIIVVDGTTFLDNGSSQSGGGLVLRHDGHGVMALKNSIFSGNGAKSGGALDSGAGKLAIDRSSFFQNSANSGGGGALSESITDSIKITASRFEGNTSATRGGALALGGAHAVSIATSFFNGNDSGTRGGAIHADGGVILTVKSSTFSGNAATTDGGAIAIADPGTSLLLASSSISRNTAVSGGGVFAGPFTKLTFTGGIFSGNAATGDGGGIETNGIVPFSVLGTLFLGNTAGNLGGAVHTLGDGTILIKGARVLGNHASFGGGMSLATTTNATVLSTLFQHNFSDNDGGGLSINLSAATAIGTITGSKFLDNFADVRGGGISIIGIGALTLKNTLVTGNTAASQSGGIYNGGPVVRIATIVTGNWAPLGPNIFP